MIKIAGMFNESRNNAWFTACLVRMGMIALFSVALLLILFDLVSASGQSVSLLPQDQVEMENETASMGSSCNIKTEHNSKSADSIKASGTQPLSNLPIGARVVDQSWEWQFRTGNNYSGASETKPVTWIVVAKNHYGANSGVTLISEELIGLHLFDNSTNRGSSWGSNHWGDSGTNNAARGSRTFLNSTGIDAWSGFYYAFPESFINNIITTTVPNKIWDTGTSYSTQDKVFIPSTTELGDTSHSSTYQIGTVYPYFEDSTDADRLAKLDGINRFYFTRSPGSTHAGVLRSVGSGGSFNDNSADNSSGGLRPAINMQSETPVSISPNADGSYSFSAEIGPIPASDADLSTLGINPGVLSPTFERDVINYTVNVVHDIGTLEIIAILSDANASLTIGGATVSSGATATVSLGSPGTATVIEIEVTAEDETTKKTYTITVSRATESEDPPIWTNLTPATAQAMAYQNGVLAASFEGFGTYLRSTGGAWTQLTGASAQVLAFDGGVLAASFDGFGTYLRSTGGVWTQLTGASAQVLAYDGGVLVASFEGFGTYLRSTGGVWTQLTGASAQVLAYDGGVLAASFDGFGTYLRDSGGTWTQVSPATASALAFGAGVLAASFDGFGTYLKNPDHSWTSITSASASALAFDGGVLAASLTGFGTYLRDTGGNWVDIGAPPAESMAFDNGKLVVSFTGHGVYLYQ